MQWPNAGRHSSNILFKEEEEVIKSNGIVVGAMISLRKVVPCEPKFMPAERGRR